VTADTEGRIFITPWGYAFLFRLTPDGAVDVMKTLPLAGAREVRVDELGRVIVGVQKKVYMCHADLADDFTSFDAMDASDTFWSDAFSFAKAVPASTPLPSPTPTPSATPTPTPSPTATPIPGGPPPALPSITVGATSNSVLEGGTAQFIFRASVLNPSQPIVVNYSISGKPILGSDYTLDQSPGVIVIPAGASTAAITVQALADQLREKSEKITLTLAPGSGYTLPKVKAARKATLTIISQGGSGRR
jgi:hypothetical protein